MSSSRLRGALSPRSVFNVIFTTFNRIVPASTRNNIYNEVRGFCYQRPLLASYLAVQLAFTFIPLAIFFSFTSGVVIFCTFIAASIIGFWVSVAGFVLLSTLSVLTFFAVGAWVYLTLCFLIIRRIALYTGYITSTVQRQKERSINTSSISPNASSEIVNPSSPAKAIPPSPRKPSTEVRFRQPSPGSSDASFAVVSDREVQEMNNESMNVNATYPIDEKFDFSRDMKIRTQEDAPMIASPA